MSIKDQIEKGQEFEANSEMSFFLDMMKCEDMCFEFNNIPPSNMEERSKIIKKILKKTTDDFFILSPFHCEYGYNIEIGNNFCANHNCVIIDAAPVTFGDDVMLGPNCGIYTSGHSLDPEKRKNRVAYARPIIIGNGVWIGGNSVILAGVTIGENTVIGAGSVVTKSIPANVIAYGNPCQVHGEISRGQEKREIK